MAANEQIDQNKVISLLAVVHERSRIGLDDLELRSFLQCKILPGQVKDHRILFNACDHAGEYPFLMQDMHRRSGAQAQHQDPRRRVFPDSSMFHGLSQHPVQATEGIVGFGRMKDLAAV